jgi:hypothetical protein
MVAASATAILKDINLSSFPRHPFSERQISLQPGKATVCTGLAHAFYRRAITNRFHARPGTHSMLGNKGNVANKVNDLKTTPARKRARRDGWPMTME